LKLAWKPSPHQARALATIQHLRLLAYSLTGKRETREYYMALLFYSLKRIIGFTSSVDEMQESTPQQLHALISAAMISSKLASCAPGREGSVFLAHAYQAPWKRRVYKGLKELIESLNYEVRHPLDRGPEDLLWPGVKDLIERSDVGLYEITSKNGNVYFELGYAIGRRKPYFALVDSTYHPSPDIAPLLQGLLMIKYTSAKSLHEQVKEVFSTKQHLGKHYFFNRLPSQQAETQPGSVLMLVADASQQADVAKDLSSAIATSGDWRVESLNLKREVNIETYYLKALAAEIVVGCFSSDTNQAAQFANAELAFALGVAYGMKDSHYGKKTVITLQEEGAKVLTNLQSLTTPFQDTKGAADVVKLELKDRPLGSFNGDNA